MKEFKKLTEVVKNYSQQYGFDMENISLKDICIINAEKEFPLSDDSYEFKSVKFLLLTLEQSTSNIEKLKLYIEKTFNHSYYVFGDNK